MANKINGLDGRPVTAGSGRAVARTAGSASSGTSAEGASAAGDVHITDSANKLASLEQMVRDMPAVDSARVEQVRNSLADGSYTVQAGHIADQLIQVERSLGQLPDPEQGGEQRGN